uniref:Ig-like domain-containing protein n=1 Tax=Malurus cyaneus samueli TaxID=2593467 RepID=A0A8C5U565_9PASS
KTPQNPQTICFACSSDWFRCALSCQSFFSSVTLYLQLPTIRGLSNVPEVVFTNKEKVQKEVKAALSENATLSCEVAQEKTEVKWYKDGKLITSSKKFKVESEGKSRRLVVGEVEKKDAGEYTCEAAGQKLTFRIDVTALMCFVICSISSSSQDGL